MEYPTMRVDTAAPAACSLDARDLKTRIALIETLNQQFLLERVRSGRFLTLIYAASAAAVVDSWVEKERDCCPFLAFRVHVSDRGLELTIEVPINRSEEADALLAPFSGELPALPGASCCGACP
jgi:hypothetical protein